MASQAEIDLVDNLINESTTRQPKRRLRDNYYHGAQRLSIMGMSTPPEMRHLQTVVNWCRTTVDALSERLNVEGFRTGNRDLDALMWQWWKRNGMSVKSDYGHIESLVQGAGFIVIGLDPKDPTLPRFTLESSACISVKSDVLTGAVTAAVRYFTDDDQTQRATLYLPNESVFLRRGSNRWIEEGRDRHNLGVVPVVPLINRARINDRFGETEMRDVMTIVDAVCRTATNLSTASETLAVPSRYVIGANREDFVDSVTGKSVPLWEGYLGRLNALTNENASVVQLSGADLKNFTETIATYGKIVSSLTGLPLHCLGVSSDGNPTAADAITAAEARHVTRAERKQETFGESWGLAMLIAARLVLGNDIPVVHVDTVWRDASTPTVAQKTDAVVKLVQTNILPVEGAWIELGYDQDKRELYRALLSSDPLERMIAALGNEAPDSLPVEDEVA